MSLWDMDVSGITPGEILKEEYLDALELSQNALARAIGVTPRSVNEIVLGRRSITAPMSIRLGAYFRQSPRFWLNLQTECDIRKALRDEKKLTSGIIPMEAVAEDQGTYGVRFVRSQIAQPVNYGRRRSPRCMGNLPEPHCGS